MRFVACILFLAMFGVSATAGPVVLDAVNDWPAASDELGVGKWGLYSINDGLFQSYGVTQRFTVAHDGTLRSIDVAASGATLIGSAAGSFIMGTPVPDGRTTLILDTPMQVRAGEPIELYLSTHEAAFVRLGGAFGQFGAWDAVANTTEWRDGLSVLMRAHVELADPLQGDLDGNGKVDLTDFGIFKENFGKSAQAIVPEPAGALLAILSFALLLAHRRKKGSNEY